MMSLFKGINYYDDRLFVLYLCRGIVAMDGNSTVKTTIYHDKKPSESHWCIVTYHNHTNYPIFSIKHFETDVEAMAYMISIEPETPLISTNGKSPQKILAYDEYERWKKENNFKDYNYKCVYKSGGSNHQELIFQTKEQFLIANPDWIRI